MFKCFYQDEAEMFMLLETKPTKAGRKAGAHSWLFSL